MLPRLPTEAEFVDVGFVAEVPAQGARFVQVGGREVMLVRRGGDIAAFSGSCTHNLARLSEGVIDRGQIVCPRHGARFTLATGKSQSSLCRDLPSYAVRIVGRRVQVRLS